MPEISYLAVEQEISKMSRAIMARDLRIGQDLIAHLRTQLSLEDVAGVMVISLERLIWFDADAFFWCVEHFIPSDVMQAIRNITSVTLYKRLIYKGFVPGQDFSVNSQGKLLLNEKAKLAIFPRSL